jgi:hypothetical protein
MRRRIHIEFAEPVMGPLVFGYGAHFGLGQMVPAPTAVGMRSR